MYFAHPVDLFCLTNFRKKKYELSGMVSRVDSYSRHFGTINKYQNGEQNLSWNVFYWYVFKPGTLNDGGEDSVEYRNRKKQCFLAAAILLFIGKIIIT